MKRSFTHNGDKLVGNGISSLKSVRFRLGMNGHERIGHPRTIGPSNDVNCSIHYLIFCSFAFINNNEVVHGHDMEDTEVTLNYCTIFICICTGRIMAQAWSHRRRFQTGQHETDGSRFPSTKVMARKLRHIGITRLLLNDKIP